MTIPISRILVTMALGAALGSCAVGVIRLDDSEPSASGAPAQNSAAPSAAPPNPAPVQAVEATAPPDPPPSKTVEEVRGECWMKADANRSTRDIDARLKFVKNCVDERMRGDPQPTAGQRRRP